MGQEEFYGEQYGHTPSSSEPINQQYYPDGNHMEPHTFHASNFHGYSPPKNKSTTSSTSASLAFFFFFVL